MRRWGSTPEAYASPKLGLLDVKAVDTDIVLAALRPIWTTKPETASRVRQRIEAVLDYAGALKAHTGENPTRWRGHLDQLLSAPAKLRAQMHHAALDWREAPSFMASLSAAEGVAARALAFAILTAARSSGVRGMTWREIDGDVWIVPTEWMKAAKVHRVPLMPDALALLGERRRDDDLVFGSPTKAGRPLSDMALRAVLSPRT